MADVTMQMGWQLFFQALREEHSLATAAEWMYRLNVFARCKGRHTVVDQIYDLKNELIKQLYQRGYAREVLLHKQKRLCRSCGGTGEHWNGEPCFRCDNGVYAVTELYAFRFEIGGRCYKWHQLKKLVDYPIALTSPLPADWQAPQFDDQEDILKMEDAWLGCCIVWWALLAHGARSKLILFGFTRTWMTSRIRKAVEPLGQLWSSVLDRMPLRKCEQCGCHYLVGVAVTENYWPGHQFCSSECSHDWVPF